MLLRAKMAANRYSFRKRLPGYIDAGKSPIRNMPFSAHPLGVCPDLEAEFRTVFARFSLFHPCLLLTGKCRPQNLQHFVLAKRSQDAQLAVFHGFSGDHCQVFFPDAGIEKVSGQREGRGEGRKK
jgi:hypothetical protein